MVRLSNSMTVLGLLNGMIGGTILLLPVMALQSGYVMAILTTAFVAFVTGYTANIIIIHLGAMKNVKQSILAHFNHKYKYGIIYNLIQFISFIPVLIIYFKLSCLQLEGLFNYNSKMIGVILIFVMFVWILINRKYNFSEHTLAYGFASIISYVIFVSWTIVSAPHGNHQVEMVGEDPLILGGALLMAFAIHDFVAQVIIKNPNRPVYGKIVFLTYVLGAVIYLYISFGSFAIVNRTSPETSPETIEDYFQNQSWEVKAIEAIYFIHLFTAFPQFLLISKIRFFQLFDREEKQRIEKREVVFILVIILFCFMFYVLDVNLSIIVDLNGAVIGYSYVVFIPVFMHFKCLYLDKSCGHIEGQPERNSEIVPNQCKCKAHYANKYTLYLETVFLVAIAVGGLVFVGATIANIIIGN